MRCIAGRFVLIHTAFVFSHIPLSAAPIVEHAAMFERRLGEGGKAIIHMEAFIARFMSLYKRFLLTAFK